MSTMTEYYAVQDSNSEPYTAAQAGRTPRVALIVGDNDTPHCGVKDYAHKLAGALQESGIDAEVLAPQQWNRASVTRFRRVLRQGEFDLLHLQYPSIGYRSSLLPHVLGLLRCAKSSIVTVHEYSALPMSQRLSLQTFRWSMAKIVWATEFEQGRFNRQLRSLGSPQDVVPIGSNIPVSPQNYPRNNTVVYFGQIRRNKGMEQFLELARLSEQAGNAYCFHVIGSVTPAHRDYAEALRQTSPPSLLWSLNLPDVDVARALSSSFAAYLPFPDGASERRGSMLAAFANGLPVLSQLGEATTQTIKDVIIEVADPAAALRELDRLSRDPQHQLNVSQASRRYANKHEWPNIAMQHSHIYEHLVGNRYPSPKGEYAASRSHRS